MRFAPSVCALLFLFISLLRSSNATYDVVSFGARGDGRTDSTQGFLRAWGAACRSNTAATIYVPRGTYLINNVAFNGPCKRKIVFEIDGSIVAPSDYWTIGKSGYWVVFRKVNRLSVIGGGTIDGRGAGFWRCRRAGKSCPVGARSMTFSWCKNVVINGLTSMNSQTIHMALDHCNNVMVKNVKIRAPSGSPNTDGIHMKSSTGITVTGSTIMTGDDCVSIAQGSKNVWIERINCGPGHGVSIGSLGDNLQEEGVQNVTVTNSVFTKAQNGVRIKAWARPSNGYATDIAFRNIIMNKVSNPVIIDQTYCPNNRGCPRQSSGVKISQVTYKNIKGTSATQVAVNFNCSPSSPCREVRLQDINLAFPGKPVTSFCKNVQGSSNGVLRPRSCF